MMAAPPRFSRLRRRRRPRRWAASMGGRRAARTMVSAAGQCVPPSLLRQLPAPHHRSPAKLIIQMRKVLLHMTEHQEIFNRSVVQRPRLARRVTATRSSCSRQALPVQTPIALPVVEQRLPAPHHRSPAKLIMQMLKVLLHMTEHQEIFNRSVVQRARLARCVTTARSSCSRWALPVQKAVALPVVEQRLPAPHHRSPAKLIIQMRKVLLHMMEHKQIFNRSVAKWFSNYI